MLIKVRFEMESISMTYFKHYFILGKKDIVTTREFMGSNMIMITRADQIITKVQYFEEQPNHGRK